jgi:uncharacterized protein YbjT (DUF2867 family)
MVKYLSNWLHTVCMTLANVSNQIVKYLSPTPAATKASSCHQIILVILVLILVIGTSWPALASDEHPVGKNSEQPGEQLPGKLVLVAGATGGTGNEVVRELLANGYRVRAFVRDEDKARASFGDDIEYAVGDVRESATIIAALDGVDALISAVGAGRGEPGNGPEFVDYGGVRNMAEAATGLQQFVLVSSIGVTHEDHALNKMFNNVLMWKFRGEEALRASGVPYTIVRPGGLLNEPGGQQAIIFSQGDDGTGTIPRADLARVCVAALGSVAALNKTFEVTTGRLLSNDSLDAGFSALIADADIVSTSGEQ